ncbi:MAG: hypothetical protein ACI8QI_000603 [Limisphaerales bacterium]
MKVGLLKAMMKIAGLGESDILKFWQGGIAFLLLTGKAVAFS